MENNKRQPRKGKDFEKYYTYNIIADKINTLDKNQGIPIKESIEESLSIGYKISFFSLKSALDKLS